MLVLNLLLGWHGMAWLDQVSAVSGATDVPLGMSEFRGSVLSIDQAELRGETSRFLLNSLEKPEISRLQWNHENCKHPKKSH